MTAYLLQLNQGIEPELHGPFATADAFARAHGFYARLAAEQNDEECLFFTIRQDENGLALDVEAFSGGYSDDLRNGLEPQVTVAVQNRVLSYMWGAYVDNFHDRGLNPDFRDEPDNDGEYAALDEWAIHDALQAIGPTANSATLTLPLPAVYRIVGSIHETLNAVGDSTDDEDRELWAQTETLAKDAGIAFCPYCGNVLNELGGCANCAAEGRL